MKKRRLKIKNILLILFIVVFLFSTTKIVLFLLDLQNNKNEIKELIKDVTDIEIEEDKEVLNIDFDKLSSINSDIVGWIHFNQDKINNPIVHTSDNSYYLNHSFEKKRNQAGTIFMDYRNTSFDDKNVVLFGHSMLDDTMFGSLQDLFKKDFFDKKENHYIDIYNKERKFTYEIFSYYVIEKEEYYITPSFSNDNDYKKFIDTLVKRSYKNFNVEISTDDYILTISTCSGTGGTSKRKVVHAKRVIDERN